MREAVARVRRLRAARSITAASRIDFSAARSHGPGRHATSGRPWPGPAGIGWVAQAAAAGAATARVRLVPAISGTPTVLAEHETHTPPHRKIALALYPTTYAMLAFVAIYLVLADCVIRNLHILLALP
jgi:hypothetical protein